jgi:hypothetical protein
MALRLARPFSRMMMLLRLPCVDVICPRLAVACFAGADEVRSDRRAIERAWNDVIPGHLKNPTSSLQTYAPIVAATICAGAA